MHYMYYVIDGVTFFFLGMLTLAIVSMANNPQRDCPKCGRVHED